MARVIRRMAGEIVEKNAGLKGLFLIGIRTRGVSLAEALAREMKRMEGDDVPLGILDITLYRDDLSTIAPQPEVKVTRLPKSLENRAIVLCDDVLFTGRTIRAALDALMDFGRPQVVRLAVLVDRGNRELPIQPDFVGERVSTLANEEVRVSFSSVDGRESVELLERRDEP